MPLLSERSRPLRSSCSGSSARFGFSNVYRSAAHGAAAADYLNFVVALTTERDVDSVNDVLRAIETLAGRSRRDPAVVELDLDLLLYGSCVDAGRRLPRPGTFTLPFVLGPLAELAPALVHPVTGERCETAWRELRRGDLRDLGALHGARLSAALRSPADAAAAVDGDDLARDVRRVADEE